MTIGKTPLYPGTKSYLALLPDGIWANPICHNGSVPTNVGLLTPLPPTIWRRIDSGCYPNKLGKH